MFCIEENFRSCFCRNKALRCKDVFGQEVGLLDVWIIDSTARLKHRNSDGRSVVYSIHTQTCLQSCLGIYRICFFVLCLIIQALQEIRSQEKGCSSCRLFEFSINNFRKHYAFV